MFAVIWVGQDGLWLNLGARCNVPGVGSSAKLMSPVFSPRLHVSVVTVNVTVESQSAQPASDSILHYLANCPCNADRYNGFSSIPCLFTLNHFNPMWHVTRKSAGQSAESCPKCGHTILPEYLLNRVSVHPAPVDALFAHCITVQADIGVLYGLTALYYVYRL